MPLGGICACSMHANIQKLGITESWDQSSKIQPTSLISLTVLYQSRSSLCHISLLINHCVFLCGSFWVVCVWERRRAAVGVDYSIQYIKVHLHQIIYGLFAALCISNSQFHHVFSRLMWIWSLPMHCTYILFLHDSDYASTHISVSW